MDSLRFILPIGISPSSKLLWLLLDAEGPLEISQPLLATRLSLSVFTIDRCIKELARRDLLTTHRVHPSGVAHTYEARRR